MNIFPGHLSATGKVSDRSIRVNIQTNHSFLMMDTHWIFVDPLSTTGLNLPSFVYSTWKFALFAWNAIRNDFLTHRLQNCKSFCFFLCGIRILYSVCRYSVRHNMHACKLRFGVVRLHRFQHSNQPPSLSLTSVSAVHNTITKRDRQQCV